MKKINIKIIKIISLILLQKNFYASSTSYKDSNNSSYQTLLSYIEKAEKNGGPLLAEHFNTYQKTNNKEDKKKISIHKKNKNEKYDDEYYFEWIKNFFESIL